MKILWLCGIVLPDFCGEFLIKKRNTCGWLTGMLHGLEKSAEAEVSLCFPIYDKDRLRDGYLNGHEYYTFLDETSEEYNCRTVDRFRCILHKCKPDLIHIWGSECSHTTAMMHACKAEGVLNRTILSIQGLAYICAEHYFADIPEEYKLMRIGEIPGIDDEKKSFDNRGKCEIESIMMAQYVIGRTDWDKACVKAVNPYLRYYQCDEILRDVFYEYAGRWKYSECKKNSIFVSQASYPIKGFHYLLRALPMIVREYPDTHVYVAGNDIIHSGKKGAYAMYLLDLIQKMKLEEHVTFLGMQSDEKMVEMYLKANVFVLPSIVENSPNSLNEAMLVGTPSVASFVGGTSNRLTHGMEGFLYPHNEPALLAYYVCRLFENKDGICNSVSARSVQKMSKLVDPEINVAGNLNVYMQVFDSILDRK